MSIFHHFWTVYRLNEWSLLLGAYRGISSPATDRIWIWAKWSFSVVAMFSRYWYGSSLKVMSVSGSVAAAPHCCSSAVFTSRYDRAFIYRIKSVTHILYLHYPRANTAKMSNLRKKIIIFFLLADWKTHHVDICYFAEMFESNICGCTSNIHLFINDFSILLCN